jgi:hypothetical protein
MGAAPDATVIADGNQSYLAMQKAGLEINPAVTQKYKDWVKANGGNLTPAGELYAEYAGAGSSGPSESGDLTLTGTDKAAEAKLADLGLTAADYEGYQDAAIVIVGRPGGESKNYVTGGTDSTTTNIFGLSADEVIRYENQGGYYPMDYFNNDQDIRRVLMQLINGTYSNGDFEKFREIYDSLLTNKYGRADQYFILGDFKSYAEAQQRVEEAYRDEKRWAKMAILNMASSGKFTSDRTIQQYEDEIWKQKPITVK